MNIFVLDRNPVKAARMQCDKHVVKMVSEAAQLLCTAFPEDKAPWKRTHYNHPCAKWTRESWENFTWVLYHGYELAYEYTRRYGKIHKSQAIIEWCDAHKSDLKWDKIEATPFVQTMPEQYRGFCPVAAYRRFYIAEKSRFAKWEKGRPAPTWYTEGLERRSKDETQTQT